MMPGLSIAEAHSKERYRIAVIGASSGGMLAVKSLLADLPANFGLPLVIVLHVNPDHDGNFSSLFYNEGVMAIEEAEERGVIRPGCTYFAPAGYHLLIESDGTFALSTDAAVCFARPSIDVLFESAADVYRERVIAVVLTGANIDGSQGARAVKEKGGVVIVQDPDEAEMGAMPRAVIEATTVDYVLPLAGIAGVLRRLSLTGE